MAKNFDGSGKVSSFYQANRVFRNMAYREVSRKTQKTSIEEACVERCQEGNEQTETWFIKEEKHMRRAQTR